MSLDEKKTQWTIYHLVWPSHCLMKGINKYFHVHILKEKKRTKPQDHTNGLQDENVNSHTLLVVVKVSFV